MSLNRKTRHFHAGKLRKTVGGVEFVEVAESKGRVFVSENGLVITPRHSDPYAGSDDSLGYKQVRVGNCKNASVHRIVLEIFSGIEIPDEMEIDHLNTNRGDNRLENLAVVTKVQNAANPLTYARKLLVVRKMNAGRVVPVIGVNVRTGEVVGPFRSQTEAAKFAGITNKNIRGVISGRRKSAGGYRWKEATRG